MSSLQWSGVLLAFTGVAIAFADGFASDRASLLGDAFGVIAAALWAATTVVIRTKQHVCALMPVGETLLLNTLRYADEVLDAAEHAPATKSLEDARVSPREFGMAVKLVEDMRLKWEPATFHDDRSP